MKCTLQWFPVYSPRCAPTTTAHFRAHLPAHQRSRSASAAARQPLIYFLPMDLPILVASHKCNHTIYGLCVCFVHKRDVVMVCGLARGLCQWLNIPWCGHSTLYPFISLRTFELFPLFSDYE